MTWTKAKTAIVSGAVTLLVTGTATVVVVKTSSHPTASSASSLTVRLNPGEMGPDAGHGPRDVGPEHPVSRPDPNARFANLTAQQRVEQARRHLPESVEDLKK